MASISTEVSAFENETKLLTLAEVSFSAMLMLQEGQIVYANPAAAAITGYPVQELLGRDVADLATPEFRDLILQRRSMHKRGETIPKHVEIKYLTKSGEERWLEYTLTFLTLNGKPTTIVNGIDITKRKQAEAELRESESVLRGFFDNTGAMRGIVEVVDDDILLIAGNAMTAALSGLGKSAIENMRATELGTSRNRIQFWIDRYRESQSTGEPVNFEYLHRSKDKEHWLSATVSYVGMSLAGRARFAYVIADISERKIAEAENRSLLAREQAARFEAEVVRDASYALTQNLSLDRVLETLLEYIGKLVPVDSANVMLLESGSGFVARALTGYQNNSARPPILNRHFGLDVYPVLRRLHATQRSVLIADTAADPDWRLVPGASHVRNWLGVPLIVSGKVVGLYSLDRSQPGFFTQEHVRLAETLAAQAASAIRNAQLFLESQHYASQLEQRIVERERAEEALRASESFRRTIIESEPECVKLVGPNCELLDMNPAGLKMIGADSLEQVVGHSVVPLLAPEWRESFIQMNERVFAGESVVSEFEIVGLNGQRLWMNSHAVPLRDLDSVVIAQLAVARDVTERKRSTQALRESEERYRELFENAKDAHYVHDLNGHYTSVNRAAEKLIGYPREKILGRKFSEFFPPDQLELVTQSIRQKLNEKGETTYETAVIDAHGRRVPVEVSSHLIYGNGVAIGVQGAARDITERKLAEEALRESEREYRGLFENAHDAILIIHPEKEIVLEVNQRACEMYGICREKFVGMSLESISKNVERGRLRIAETLRAGTSHNFETIQRRGDGTEMSLQVNASVVEYKGQLAIQSINRDITERRRAEEALRQSEERFSKAFHSSPAALSITLLKDGRLLEVNSAFLRMTGYTREEIIGRSTVELGLWENQDRLSMAQALRDHQAVDNLKIKFRKKCGEFRDGLLSAELIQLGAGEPSVLGIAQDVTERYRAEEALKNYPRQLIEAQESERQSIARELHDQIGQILTAINLNLSALWETCESSQAKMLVHEGLAIVDEALGQVRDLSFELRPSLLDDLGLVAALRWYCDRFAHRTGLHVSTAINLPENPCRLNRELETACFRIVQEALTNVVRHARAKNVAIVVNNVDDEIHLSVTDDGIGFEVRSQSLTEFTTRVGLRGMRERALALGGKLDVTSSASDGTRITATLPKS
ncbi:MAG TPA: PAS domain S-box protein [Pyrinomonadaceae bacterium]|nr:PAS domain S-box protein [Pyrinomonadaceae bacterium]